MRFRIALLLLLGGCTRSIVPASSPSPHVPQPGIYEGRYVQGFEASGFFPCGLTEEWETHGDLWDREADTGAFRELSLRMRALAEEQGTAYAPEVKAGGHAFVRLRGTPTVRALRPALGYDRGFIVEEILEVQPGKEDLCPSSSP